MLKSGLPHLSAGQTCGYVRTCIRCSSTSLVRYLFMQNPGSMLRSLLPEGPRGTLLAASCVPRRTWSGFSKPSGDAQDPAGGGSGEASVGRAALVTLGIDQLFSP